MPSDVCSHGDSTCRPVTGRTPGDAERVRAAVTIAKGIEEAGA